MRRNILSLVVSLAAIGICTSSCDKWLEASSATEIRQNDLLTSREGFHDALTGVYIDMGSSDLYGGTVTWRYLDLTCYPYNESQSTIPHQWQMRRYSSVSIVDIVDGIWATSYNAIANINSILPYLDQRRGLFNSELEYNLVKGELLGLRAFLHFDLIRWYGVGKDISAAGNLLTVPYVTTIGKDVTPQRSYDETFALLLEDLSQAEECLADDPIQGIEPEGWEQGPNAEGYWTNRNLHFNIYAAKLLRIRVNWWLGNLTEAATLAQSLIDELEESPAVDWVNPTEAVAEINDYARDWNFYSEHIFRLDVTGMGTEAMQYLMGGGSSGNYAYHINAEFISNELFNISGENALAGVEDIRGTAMLLRYADRSYDCYKLYYSSSMQDSRRSKMALMRMSELYYIIAEARLADGGIDEAMRALDTVRSHRGISSSLVGASNPKRELTREIMREFIDEGQIFFWFKHLGLDDYPGEGYVSSLSENDFILPYPIEETSYGRVQDRLQ